MDLTEFQSLVEGNSEWFRGVHPETPESIAAAEGVIGFPLPRSMRWLLQNWGYSSVCGIEALDQAVATTVRCRQSMCLPLFYLILMDWGDAGVVYLESDMAVDSDDWPVRWVGVHNMYRLAAGEPMDSDCDTFAGFGEWVANCLSVAKDRSTQLE
ncbi:MAG: SMI1/KNR4 family protein [Rhodopirellula sp.]|nr:SMI1/KNR4 family protein [Rhodopirellula sp.]